ncbi:MAG: SDR family oxidoreductase [Chloroflexota bacterium]|nr:SDR family oxidoreductase [Dehalococcoidia bacterium]MDW8252876.1 SDR family oxidoreductase [Chloroflexota bacterium]
MSGVLAGRTAIITGASRGIGRAIAEAFVEAGASVLIAARSSQALAETEAALRPRLGAGQQLRSLAVDVGERAQIDALISQAVETFGRVHILVNNAGIYGPKGRLETIAWEEWEQALRVNLIGSVYAARALLPHLRAHGGGKIIQLSGGGATSPMPYLTAYAASKAAVVRFVESLALEVRDARIDVNAIAPGAINTGMLDEIIAAGPERVGEEYYRRALRQRDEGGAPIDQAAALAVWLASSASDGITGKLISAVWDPWRDLGRYRDDLSSSDVYTLRRIVPKDRGLEWG